MSRTAEWTGDIEVEIEYADLKECSYYAFEAKVTHYFEPKYGADADGNRGEPRWFHDETILSNPRFDGIAIAMDEVPPDIQERACELAEEKASQSDASVVRYR